MPPPSPAPHASIPRRAALGGLLALCALPVLSACASPKPGGRAGGPSTPSAGPSPLEPAGSAVFAEAMAGIEQRSGAQVGVFALDTGSQRTLEHRADQRFMMCSVWKPFAVGLVLLRSQNEQGLLGESAVVPADPGPIAEDSPFAKGRLGRAATYAELCQAAVQLSDNLAANLLLDLLGGPGAVTGFLRSFGDTTTRLDRREEEMNYGRPEDLLDTTTPRAAATSCRRLLIGSVLAPRQRQQLVGWMLGTKTGDRRIRAGLPSSWKVADKTGTASGRPGGAGQGAVANDVAVVWPDSGRDPFLLAVLTTSPGAERPDEGIIAETARAARTALSL